MGIVQFVSKSLDSDLDKIRRAVREISEEQVWHRMRESANSIGNLCLHLAGAEYQRISSAIGGKPLIRERSAEFTTEGGYSAAALIDRLTEVREASRLVLEALEPADLQRELRVYFKQEDWDRMYAGRPEFAQEPAYRAEKIEVLLLGMATHYSYHTGQIMILSKLLRPGDQQLLTWKH